MEVTVYTLPSCVQCDSTKSLLDKNNVRYDTIDLSLDADAMEYVRSLGYQAAPVVVAGNRHWSGFRIEKIKSIVAEIETENGKS